MIKVLYIVSTLKKAGPTSQLYYIISNLEKDIEPILVTLSPQPKENMLEDFSNLSIKHYQLDLSRIRGAFEAKSKLKEIIAFENPDLIHSQGYRGDILASKFSKKLPILCTVRNFPQLDFPMTYGNVIGRLMTANQIKSLKRAKVVCAVSDAVKKNLQDTFGLTNLYTVLNGVDTKRYSIINSDSKMKNKRELGLENFKRVWLTSLGKDNRKNTITVVEAFKKFSEINSEDALIIIGDGEQRLECQRVSGNSDQIKFFGRVHNVEYYLNSSDYFISASKAEGLPNAVLEAMACGLPSVLSDIPPHRELYKINPKGSILFKTESSDDLLSKLLTVISMDRLKMSESTNSSVTNFLTSENMSLNYQKIYRKLQG